MHTYIATFNDEAIIFGKKETREGTLDWLDVAEVADEENPAIVDNISRFFPLMMDAVDPARYHCTYIDGQLVNFEILTL